MKRCVWPMVLVSFFSVPVFGAAAEGADFVSESVAVNGFHSLLSEAFGRLKVGHEPLRTDDDYVMLSDRSGKIGIDDGLFFVRDSVHVTDIMKDALFLSVEVLDVDANGAVSVRMSDFRMDGDGSAFRKTVDGEFVPIAENENTPDAIAIRLIREKLADEAEQERFLKEIEQIALRKAGLSESDSSVNADKKKPSQDTDVAPTAAVGDPEKSDASEDDTGPHTRIEVVIAPSGETQDGDSSDSSESAGDVVFSIESRN